MATWNNDDGLMIRFGQDQARETQSIPAVSAPYGAFRTMTVDINWDDLPTFTADLNNDGTNEAFSDDHPYIPAGAFITRAFIVVEEAFASGTDYDIGLYDAAGNALDAVGIDEAILLASLAANEVHTCDGANVGGTITEAVDAYIVVAETGSFTAGKGKLVIEYCQVDV